MNKQIAILDAPSNLGLMPPKPGIEPGVIKMPKYLRQYGILDKINAIDAGSVNPSPYNFDFDPKMGIRNSNAIRDYTLKLADAVERLIQIQYFPLVLGGDCSILLGPMLALKRLGTYGLLFIDGHRDFKSAKTSNTGGAAGMDLALVTGYGPDELTTFDDYDSLVAEENIAAIGFRDHLNLENDGSAAIKDTSINLFDLESVRLTQPDNLAKKLISTMGSQVSGFWIHLDVDVLDSEIMPAVDSPEDGGMTYLELDMLLRNLLESGQIIGMEITIYDPERDPEGEVGKELVNWISSLFKT